MATTDQIFFSLFVYLKFLERELKFELVKNEMLILGHLNHISLKVSTL